MAQDLPDPSSPAAAPVLEHLGRGVVLRLSAHRVEVGAWLSEWSRAAEDHCPRAVVVADLGDDDLEDVAAEVQELVGEDTVITVRYLPLDREEGGFAGVIDLATHTIHEYPAEPGAEHRVGPCDPEHVALTADAHTDLITLVATYAVNDGALAAMIQGRPFEVAAEFAAAVSAGGLCPVVPALAVDEVDQVLALLE